MNCFHMSLNSYGACETLKLSSWYSNVAQTTCCMECSPSWCPNGLRLVHHVRGGIFNFSFVDRPCGMTQPNSIQKVVWEEIRTNYYLTSILLYISNTNTQYTNNLNCQKIFKKCHYYKTNEKLHTIVDFNWS